MNYLKNKSIIRLVLFTLIFFSFLLPITNSKLDVTTSSDDNQYWTLGIHHAITNSYGISNAESALLDDPSYALANNGIRRGEVLYPIYISTIIKATLDRNQLTKLSSDCIYNIEYGGCSSLKNSIKYVNLIPKILFFIFLTLFIFTNTLNLYKKIFLITIFIYTFPSYNKDSLTYSLLCLFCYFYLNKFKKISYSILSLIPLINPVFLYSLYIFLLVEFYLIFKEDKLNYKKALILFLLLPSMLWSFRNYKTNEVFSIADRGPLILTIRAEFMSEDYEKLKDAYFWYTPSNIITSKVKLYWLGQSNSLESSRELYDRGNPNCIVCRRHTENGYVFQKLLKNYKQNYGNLTEVLADHEYTKVNDQLYEISKSTFIKNPKKFLFLTTVFSYRGLFPEFNNINFTNNSFNNLLSVYLSLLRMLFLPSLLCFIIFQLIKNKNSTLGNQIVLMFLFLFSFYSGLTHFIPRYSALIVPLAIYSYISISSKQYS